MSEKRDTGYKMWDIRIMSEFRHQEIQGILAENVILKESCITYPEKDSYGMTRYVNKYKHGIQSN